MDPKGTYNQNDKILILSLIYISIELIAVAGAVMVVIVW
jgi:hypothetical protein